MEENKQGSSLRPSLNGVESETVRPNVIVGKSFQLLKWGVGAFDVSSMRALSQSSSGISLKRISSIVWLRAFSIRSIRFWNCTMAYSTKSSRLRSKATLP